MLCEGCVLGLIRFEFWTRESFRKYRFQSKAGLAVGQKLRFNMLHEIDNQNAFLLAKYFENDLLDCGLVWSFAILLVTQFSMLDLTCTVKGGHGGLNLVQSTCDHFCSARQLVQFGIELRFMG